MCTEEFELVDLVDFGVVALSDSTERNLSSIGYI